MAKKTAAQSGDSKKKNSREKSREWQDAESLERVAGQVHEIAEGIRATAGVIRDQELGHLMVTNYKDLLLGMERVVKFVEALRSTVLDRRRELGFFKSTGPGNNARPNASDSAA